MYFPSVVKEILGVFSGAFVSTETTDLKKIFEQFFRFFSKLNDVFDFSFFNNLISCPYLFLFKNFYFFHFYKF